MSAEILPRGWNLRGRIYGNADVSIDTCPKCKKEGYAHKKWVWDGGHANGRYYLYFKHMENNTLHYAHPLDVDGSPKLSVFGFHDLDRYKRRMNDKKPKR